MKDKNQHKINQAHKADGKELLRRQQIAINYFGP
jgi:hypothetical protein